MYITEAMLEAAERRWGQPRRVALAFEISEPERDLIRGSRRDGRSHDITLFIERPRPLGEGAPEGRAAGERREYVVIAKPPFPEGVWRAPSGGARRGEDLEEGARREALEETGLEVRLLRYLLRVDARFSIGAHVEPWQTHVFLARAESDALAPRDRREIRAARWATRDEIQGPIRAALLSTGHALFRYRVVLTDATFARIDEPARAR